MHPRRIRQYTLEDLDDSPVILVNDTRHIGKSTLVRTLEQDVRCFTFDDPAVLAAAQANPFGFIGALGDEWLIRFFSCAIAPLLTGHSHRRLPLIPYQDQRLNDDHADQEIPLGSNGGRKFHRQHHLHGLASTPGGRYLRLNHPHMKQRLPFDASRRGHQPRRTRDIAGHRRW
ncbi:hypothetical protein [Halotalea alkalilenta]|uniref:hypothetical protein n=1 Tax=Halotalea alkalilenta TaxID=376489 RepID=UPI0016810D52|nr:hypothetical protein [Halotalea alkalilenta]